jgi:hypothetical protein
LKTDFWSNAKGKASRVAAVPVAVFALGAFIKSASDDDVKILGKTSLAEDFEAGAKAFVYVSESF